MSSDNSNTRTLGLHGDSLLLRFSLRQTFSIFCACNSSFECMAVVLWCESALFVLCCMTLLLPTPKLPTASSIFLVLPFCQSFPRTSEPMIAVFDTTYILKHPTESAHPMMRAVELDRSVTIAEESGLVCFQTRPRSPHTFPTSPYTLPWRISKFVGGGTS